MLKVMLAALMACLGAALAVGATSAAAQSWPSQPIHIVVPFPPGGGTDALAHSMSHAAWCSGVRPRPPCSIGQWMPA